MKTSLTKSLGLKETNWKDIFTCGKNGLLSNEEIAEYLELLEEWNTCPCGNLSIHIPRNETDNSPQDFILDKLGKEVVDIIRLTDGEKRKDIGPNFNNALNILEMIKLREKFLLQELKSELEEKIAANTKQLLADKKALKEVSA